MANHKLIVKSNRLVEASYRLDLAEQRLVLLAIESARSSGVTITTEHFLTVHADEYARTFGLDMKNAYHQLREAATGLYQRSVRIHDIDQQTAKPCVIDTRWMSTVKYVEGAGLVRFQFSGFVIPYKASAPMIGFSGLEKALFQGLKKKCPGLTEQYILDLAKHDGVEAFSVLQTMDKAFFGVDCFELE